MSYILKQNYASTSNYTAVKRTITPSFYIVWHYTANDGDTDEANANYFKTAGRNASAHAFVDDNSITISVPIEYTAWSVGGNKWSDCQQTGGGTLYGIAKNTNTINIELCDTKKNGKYDVSDATLANAIEFTKELMNKYGIPLNHVIRHFDVNGKHCPAWALDNSTWESIKAKIGASSPAAATPKKYYRIQLGAFGNKNNADKLAQEIKTKGFDTIVKQINGLYKCQVGAFSNKSNADAQLKKLQAAGYKDAFITYC